MQGLLMDKWLEKFIYFINRIASIRRIYEANICIHQGTLDAIMSDNSAESNQTTDKIFTEYFRVLKNGGRYICVTLAQDFILKKVLEYFPKNGWLVRLHKVA